VFGVLTSFVAKKLRKANILTTALSNNAGSFVNESGDDLHIRKIVMQSALTGSVAINDSARASLDEVPTIQSNVDDSRSHILGLYLLQTEATTTVGKSATIGITFERGQLVLEPDEAFFVNNLDLGGTPNIATQVNIWYED